MQSVDSTHTSTPRWPIGLALLLVVGVAGLVSTHAYTAHYTPPTSPQPLGKALAAAEAPELAGVGGAALDWLNTDQPIKMKDLRGKIVVLDFWTLCCINCIHTLPDLAKIEKKFENEVVVIGVHSAKFKDEKETESIRNAILRYEITHPVVNDAEMHIWNSYGVQSWPTLWVIDPEGHPVISYAGEGNYDKLSAKITELISTHKRKKTLNEKPMKFALERERMGPLSFPGKVLADGPGKRLFIADSTHHRIVITDMDGKKIDIAGTGEAGKADGAFDKATFNDPQGMALKGDTLYVADRKNNLIRALDLSKQTVKTIAGNGKQGQVRTGPGSSALSMGLNSPWDLYLLGNHLYIAMAGHHQIWVLDLAKNYIHRYAGSGFENIGDGNLNQANFAQPSGLTSDGKTLYVADSEISAIRAISLETGAVRTIVGQGLFEFGDVDGVGAQVRLQHALGVVFYEGKLYVADTYNSKIKVIDPAKQSCATYLGGGDGWFSGPPFNAPGGISVADGKLYVADTNAHRIRVIDLRTRALSTLALSGVEAPKRKE